MSETPAWSTCGKTFAQRIRELSSFEDHSPEVRRSVDDAATHRPISLVEKPGETAALVYCGEPTDRRPTADDERHSRSSR